jgi:hypothetical protein
MAVITTGSFPKELRPGVFAFTQMKYDEHKPFWPLMFERETSTMQYEELVSGNSFGLVPAKGQGDKIKYMAESQGAVTRATHVTRAAGYIITLEEATYNLYEKLGKQRGARLAAAFPRTKDKVAADFFNAGFSGSGNPTYGDGKTLFATDHPSLAGNYQNKLSVDADMSEASIEDLCVLIRKATDNVGNKIGLQPKRLMHSSDDMFNATRILESEKQNDTANNALNALKSKGAIPEHFDNPYLTDSDAFFILTDIATTDGLIYFDAIPFKLMMDNDSDTLNEKHFGFEAYSFTVGDPRAAFGSQGA